MKRESLPKFYHSAAERAAEHYAINVCGCYQTQRATRNQFQKVDFWGADVTGRTRAGRVYYLQVTTGGKEALRQRRKKLEKHAWNPFEDVLLLQLNRTKEGRRFRYYFTIWRYLIMDEVRSWTNYYEGYDVPKEWFKSKEKV